MVFQYESISIRRAISVWFSGWNASSGAVHWSEADLFLPQSRSVSSFAWEQFELDHNIIPFKDPSSDRSKQLQLRLPVSTVYPPAGAWASSSDASGSAPNLTTWSGESMELKIFAWSPKCNATTLSAMTSSNEVAEIPSPSITRRNFASIPAPQPGQSPRIAQISGGGGSFCAVRDDQTAICWGRNDAAQLGAGHTMNMGNSGSSNGLHLGQSLEIGPVQHITMGIKNACAVKASGAVVCWGSCTTGIACGPNQGLLGDSPGELAELVPLELGKGVVSIAVGEFHAVAIRQDGSAVAWGENSYGQLGMGPGNMPSPWDSDLSQTSMGFTDKIVAAAVGMYHTCIVRQNGAVTCLGNNFLAQLGSGDWSDFGASAGDLAQLDDRSVNVGPVVSLVSADFMTCAVRADAAVICWGDSSDARSHTFANGAGTFGGLPGDLTPESSSAVGGSFVRVYLSSTHTCALRVDGAVRCWGANPFGELGFGPVQAFHSLDQAHGLTSDDDHPVGDFNTDAYWWGGRAVDIALAEHATCVVRADMSMHCVGRGAEGALASSSLDNHEPSTSTVDAEQQQRMLSLFGSQAVIDSRFATQVKSISCGQASSCCALTSRGDMICFGAGGDIGLETASSVQLSAGQTHFGMRHPVGRAKAVSIGTNQGCAILMQERDDWSNGGPLACWSQNPQLGATGVPRTTDETGVGTRRGTMRHAARIANVGNVISVSTSSAYTCAVRDDIDGSTVCFGMGFHGQLGDLAWGRWPPTFGPTPVWEELTPTVAISNLGPLAFISTGRDTVCGIRRDASAVCWGAGDNGRLGNNGDTDVGLELNPISPAMRVLVGDVMTLDVGVYHSCAIRLDGSVVCWGDDVASDGYLGCAGCTSQGGTAKKFVNTTDGTAPVGLAVGISVGEVTTCIVRENGDVFCWGYNSHGELGFPLSVEQLGHTGGDMSTMVSPGFGPSQQVSASAGMTCVLRLDGSTACLGSSAAGLGHGHSLPLRSEAGSSEIGGSVSVSPVVPHDWFRRPLELVGCRFIHPSMSSLPVSVRSAASPNLRAVPFLQTTAMHWLQTLGDVTSAPVFSPALCPGGRIVQWGSAQLCTFDPAVPVWWQRTPTASIAGVALRQQVLRWGEHVRVAAGGGHIHITGQLHWLVMWSVPQVVLRPGNIPCTNVVAHDWDHISCSLQPGVGANLTLAVVAGPDAWVPSVTLLGAVSYQAPKIDFAVVHRAWSVSLTASPGITFAPPSGGGVLRIVGSNFGPSYTQASVTVGEAACSSASALGLVHLDSETFCVFGSRGDILGNTSLAAGQVAEASLRISVAGQRSQLFSVPIGIPQLTSAAPSVLQAGNSSAGGSVEVLRLRGRFLEDVVAVRVAGAACISLQNVSYSQLGCQLSTAELSYSGSTIAYGVTVKVGAEWFEARGMVQVMPPPPVGDLRVIVVQQPTSIVGGEVAVKGTFLGAAARDIVSVQVPPWGACTGVVWIDSNELRCSVPPGAGARQLLQLHLRGGYTREGRFDFAPAHITSVTPPWLIQHHSSSAVERNLTLCASARLLPAGFNPAAGQMAAGLRVTAGGQACLQVALLDTTCFSCRVALKHLTVGGGTTVSLLGLQAGLSSALFTVRAPPGVSAVDPPIVSAAGNASVKLLGQGFDGHSLESIRVVVGTQQCHVTAVDGLSVSFLTPAWTDTASAVANVHVQFASGHQFELVKSLQFARPELFGVQNGTVVLPAPWAAAQVQHTISTTGLSLNDGAAAAASIQIVLSSGAAFSCRALGGQVVFEPNGRSATCLNFQPQRMALEPREQDHLGFLQVVTSQGLIAVTPLGSIRLVGKPTLAAVPTELLRPGAVVTVTGTNLGQQQQDILGVSVGTQAAQGIIRSSDRVLQFIVPSPAGLTASVLRGLAITLTLRSGFNATLPTTVDYFIAAQRPVSPPPVVCPYRTEGGQARVYVEWEEDSATLLTPVTGWSIRMGVVGMGGNSTLTSSAVERVVTADTAAVGDFITNAEAPRHCSRLCGPGGNSSTWGTHCRQPLGPRLRLSLAINSIPAGVLLVAVAAQVRATSGTGPAAVGPYSNAFGPLFPHCAPDQVLWTVPLLAQDWASVRCVACPVGARCGGLPYEGMHVAPGFYRASWRPARVPGDLQAQFLPCVSAAACAGSQAASTAFAPSLYFSGGLQQPSYMLRPHVIPGTWTAQQLSAPGDLSALMAGQWQSSNASGFDADDQCHSSRGGALCSACKPGFSATADEGAPCTPCPSSTISWLRLSAGLLAVVAVIAALTVSTIRSKGAPTTLYVALMKLLVNHLQQLAVAAAFPFKWPQELQSMFSVFEATSSVGEALIRADCLEVDAVSPFRGSQIVILLVPLALAVCIVLAWCVLKPGRCCALPERESEASQGGSRAAAVARARSGTVQSRVNNPMRASMVAAQPLLPLLLLHRSCSSASVVSNSLLAAAAGSCAPTSPAARA